MSRAVPGRAAIVQVAIAALVCGCVGSLRDGSADAQADAPPDGGSLEPDEWLESSPPWEGFIGSPCRSFTDCAYEGAVCLGSLPGGMCTLGCDRLCADREGFAETFCVAADALPGSAGLWPVGACFSRCDDALFPATGCRAGYACIAATRASEPETESEVCMPEPTSPRPTECLSDLLALGVDVEPTTLEPEHPATYASLTCLVDEPVIVHPPVLGVDLVTTSGGPTPNVIAACAMARALALTVDDLRPRGVTRIRHMGTYSCRVVAGTDRLSRHAFADAIDIAAFDFEDGSTLTVDGDWEEGADPPQTEAGLWLYDAAHRWFDLGIWNVVLTPNYNLAHHDHFHLDLTPDAHFIKDAAFGYLGPAPFDD